MATEAQRLLKQLRNDMAELSKPIQESLDYVNNAVKGEVKLEQYDPVFEGNKPDQRELLAKKIALEVGRFDTNKDGKLSNHEAARYNAEYAARIYDRNLDGNVTYAELNANLADLHKRGTTDSKSDEAALVKMFEGKFAFIYEEVIPKIQEDLKSKGQPLLSEQQQRAVVIGAFDINDDNRIAAYKGKPETAKAVNEVATQILAAADAELNKPEIVHSQSIDELVRSNVNMRFKAGPRPKKTSAVDTDTIEPPQATPKVAEVTKVASR